MLERERSRTSRATFLTGRVHVWRSVTVALVLAMLVAACSSASGDGEASGDQSTVGTSPATSDDGTETQTQTPSGRLVVSAPPPITELSLPHLGSATNKIHWDLFYDYLLHVNPETGELEPRLAVDWETSSDARTWTFTLRDDVQFHKGEGAFTSADVEFTIELIMSDPARSARAQVWIDRLESIETPDDHTVVFHLKQAWPDLGYELADRGVPALCIVSKSYIARVGEDEAAREPVGTGPFEYAGRVEGSSITGRAFTDYWGTPPGVEEVTLNWVSEDATRLAQLQSGEAQIAVLPRRLAQGAAANGARLVYNEASPTGVWIVLYGQFIEDRDTYDQDVPWLDARVREALNLAIDREQINNAIFNGEGRPLAIEVYQQNFPGYRDSWEPYPYDPDRARQLLADAGYPDGFEFTIRSYAMGGVPEMPDLAQAVADAWRSIGLDVNVQSIEFNEHRANYVAREIPGVAFPMRTGPATFYDMKSLLSSFYDSEGVMGAIESPGFDETIEAAYQEPDFDRNVELISEMYDQIYREFRSVPIVAVPNVFTASPDVAEWTQVDNYALDLHTVRLAD